jgi:hypothetical protein
MRRDELQKSDEAIMTEVVFSEEEDKDIVANNHGAHMANLFEDFGNGGKKTTPAGLSRIMKYFSEIPKEDRKLANEYFLAHLENRGLHGG